VRQGSHACPALGVGRAVALVMVVLTMLTLVVACGADTATSPATSAPRARLAAAATATALPTATPTPKPTPTDTPIPAPTAVPLTCTNAGCSPWGYNFSCCSYIYSPPGDFCTYFACIPSFWTYTNGYVMECRDATFSHSGGRSGSCSSHGGNWRPLLKR